MCNFYIFVEVLTEFIHLSVEVGEHLYNYYFELYLVDSLAQFHLVLFLQFYPVFLFGTYSFFFKILFIFRERGRGREGEGEKQQWLPYLGTRLHSGMCPGQELNQ